MKNGIYFVSFKSNMQDFGSGTVVVNNNTVNGGDFGYVYKGRIEGDSVELSVNRHDPSASSIVGNISSFTLTLTLKETSSGYAMTGVSKDLHGAQVQVRAKFIGDLA